MSSFIDGGKNLTLSSIGTWAGTTVLIVIFVFIATVLVGMLTENVGVAKEF
ncbi:hypothetical protein KHA80_15300 [Anaerobacillus sp. HL2]|nr:hypothetical protein KHA80_15300 [Anaerobacillus sp. HL2]